MSSRPISGLPDTSLPSDPSKTVPPGARRETYSGPSRRLYGIDAARAIAVVGMVMVHFGPTPMPDTALGWLYGLSHGRASVLFVLLAGVGVSLLAGYRSGGRPLEKSLALVRGRLLLRGALLLPLGLWLQRLDHGVLVILQYYALYFLFAALVLTVSDRWLAAGAAVALAGGPLIYLAGGLISPGWYAEDPAMLGDTLGKLIRNLLLSGAYPLITWAAPLLAGIWIGRRGLAAPVVQWRLITGGVAIALTAAFCSALVAGEPGSYSLLSNEPHSQMPLWMAGSIGSACAVLGAMLLVADRRPHFVWPLVATGQMALSVYVGHLLFLAVAADLVRSEAVSGAFFSVGAFMLVVGGCCALWRMVSSRGPLEMVLRMPGWAIERTVVRLRKYSEDESV